MSFCKPTSVVLSFKMTFKCLTTASDTLYLVQIIHSLNINIRFSVVSCNKTRLFLRCFVFRYFYAVAVLCFAVLCFAVLCSRLCVSLFLDRRGFMFRSFVFAVLFRGFVFAVINVNPPYGIPTAKLARD